MFNLGRKNKLYDIVAHINIVIDDKRLTHVVRAVFLSDWKHCIETGKPLTKIIWQKNKDIVVYSESWEKINSIIHSASRKPDRTYEDKLSDEAVSAINHVVETMNRKTYQENFVLVSSVFPIFYSECGDILDLASCAKKYASNQEKFASS